MVEKKPVSEKSDKADKAVKPVKSVKSESKTKDNSAIEARVKNADEVLESLKKKGLNAAEQQKVISRVCSILKKQKSK